MKNSYLGNEYSDAVIKSELERYNVSYKQLSREELLESVSEEINNGNVIGWFQGKMDTFSLVTGASGFMLSLSSLNVYTQPTEFEQRQLTALAEIEMLLRERGFR